MGALHRPLCGGGGGGRLEEERGSSQAHMLFKNATAETPLLPLFGRLQSWRDISLPQMS